MDGILRKQETKLERIKDTFRRKFKTYTKIISRSLHQQKWTPNEYLIISGTLFLLLSVVIGYIYYMPYFETINLHRKSTLFGSFSFLVFGGLLVLYFAFLGYLFWLYKKYKEIQSVPDENLPFVTIIVPAYNEGKLVYHTLMSLANSNYPADKMQIISIDDGSKDDTWQWMLKAKYELLGRVHIYQQPKNKGKRHALYRGFHLAEGEIFVTVDSDSLVEADTLRNLVSPFVVNENCGAVAGNVKVLNNQSSMIPRMLNVSFVFSFEFIRCAQSVLKTVLCTPGALAAYKKDAVMTVLPDWINQTFMGKPSDIGEDRAMTNMILKQGYDVLFQRNASVLTNTPEKFESLYKMFIRWERSNVRENIMMSRFAFTDFRKGDKTGTRILLLNQWLRVIMAYPLMISMLIFILNYPLMFVTTTLFGIALFSSIQVFFYARKYNLLESFWAYPYSIFYTFSLFWITPYAIATAARRGWLTRG